jgi:hypothetical protein
MKTIRQVQLLEREELLQSSWFEAILAPIRPRPLEDPMKRLRLLLLGLVVLTLASPAAAMWPRSVVAEMGSATW